MLADHSHRPQPITAEPIELPAREKEILRSLVADLAEIAALPIHREKAELCRWTKDLDSVRPMLWINEIPWHKMYVDDELTLRTEHPWAREWETTLRYEPQRLWQWAAMAAEVEFGL